MAAPNPQHKNRKAVIAKDQFGRAWEVMLDTPTLGWVAPPILRDCRPPFATPAKYVRPVLGEDKTPVMGQIFVDYARMRKDILERRIEWKQGLQSVAKKMYPHNYGEMLQSPSRDLLVEAGPGPLPVEFVEAALSGNSWALGRRKPDGTFFPRPRWVTDAMLDDAAALRRAFGWREAVEVGTVDPSRYADETDEDAVDPYGEIEEQFDPRGTTRPVAPVKTAQGRPGRPAKVG